MSPLEIKTPNLDGTGWVRLGTPLEPGEAPSSISNNPPGGEREIYFFHCERDNSSSVIQRIIRTKEQQNKEERIFSATEYEEVARLREGDKPFDLTVRTDWGQEATLRFIHHKER